MLPIEDSWASLIGIVGAARDSDSAVVPSSYPEGPLLRKFESRVREELATEVASRAQMVQSVVLLHFPVMEVLPPAFGASVESRCFHLSLTQWVEVVIPHRRALDPCRRTNVRCIMCDGHEGRVFYDFCAYCGTAIPLDEFEYDMARDFLRTFGMRPCWVVPGFLSRLDAGALGPAGFPKECLIEGLLCIPTHVKAATYKEATLAARFEGRGVTHVMQPNVFLIRDAAELALRDVPMGVRADMRSVPVAGGVPTFALAKAVWCFIFKQVLTLVPHPIVVQGRGRVMVLSMSGDVIPASPPGWSDPPAIRLQLDGQGTLFIDDVSVAEAVSVRNKVNRQLAPSGVLYAAADAAVAFLVGGSLPGEVTNPTASLAASPWLSGLLHMIRRACQEMWTVSTEDVELLNRAVDLRALLPREIDIPQLAS